MWKSFTAAVVLAVGAWTGGAVGAEPLSTVISSCAKDNGPPDCPVTYQAVGADDCLQPQAQGNRACLIRMATAAAEANQCDQAFRLVSACGCHSTQSDVRDAIKAAGPSGVCSYLRNGK